LGIVLAIILVKLQPQGWRMLEWRMLQPWQLVPLILLTLPLGGWLRSLGKEGAWTGYPFLGMEYATRYVMPACSRAAWSYPLWRRSFFGVSWDAL
jgi:hypothetical protein